MQNELILYTDGACSGNPGPGGWAWVLLLDGSIKSEDSGGERETTNNRMELIAVIRGLEFVLDGIAGGIMEQRTLEVRTDSQYVKNGITAWIANWKANGWKTAAKKPVKNRELWEKLDMLAGRMNIKFIWVEGHAGEKWNEYCDSLAREAIAKL